MKKEIQIAFNPSSGKHRRTELTYHITPEEIAQYNEKGYVILNEVLTEEEVAGLEPWFEHFVSGKEQDKMGRDFCDMSQPYGTPIEEFKLVNAMLPSTYCPAFAGNIFMQLSQNIAQQLYENAAIDYEQFLAKKPQKEQAEFAMHQDLGYWPKTKNTWTATFSLALNDANVENGCLQVVPGSNKETELRQHRPKEYGDHNQEGVNREESHTLVIDMKPSDEILYLPLRRGSITIHDERIVHGSAGNLTDDWRKTYIIAYRDATTIAEERAIGFTHSHNDVVEWDKIIV
jgi:Phytanoyl-CoA dioxygenase (PhyH)